MKVGLRIMGFVILLLTTAVDSVSTSVYAQDTEAVSTPDLQTPAPKFGILPVGDHPDGFFRDLLVRPGEELELSVVVENFGEVPVNLRTFKVNAMTAPNGGFMPGTEVDQPSGATKWIDYPSIELSLDPGQEQQIAFSVSIPHDASPGQYISGLMVSTVDPISIPGTDVLDQSLNYVMSISFIVDGETQGSFDLGDPSVDGRYLEIPVTNTGNYLVRPSGELTLTDEGDKVILSAPIQMGAVYAGDSTLISIRLPDQMASGDYILDLDLKDEQSGVTDSVGSVTISVSEPVDPTGISVLNASIQPNAEEIVFANVDITLINGGQELPATNVTLDILRDGDPVDSFPLATNQVLLNGENQFTTRYLPADMWQSGEYTFRIKVSAVDPNGGQETILLDEELDATIVVP